MLIEYKQCEWCGKMFYIKHPSLWRYKQTSRGKLHFFCSWGCLSTCRKNSKQKVNDDGSVIYDIKKDAWKRKEEDKIE